MVGLSSWDVAVHNSFREQTNDQAEAIGLAMAEVHRLNRELCAAQAGANALQAVVKAFRAEHPDSPLLAETGRTLTNGQPETRVFREAFVPAFDAKMSERADVPAEWRDHVADEIPAPQPVAEAKPAKTLFQKLFW